MRKKILFISLTCFLINIIFHNQILFAYSTDKPSFETLKKQGITAYYNKQYEEAETYLTQAMKSNPNNLNIILYLSSTYIKLRKYELGLEMASTSLKINPNSDHGYMYQGKSYMGLQQHKKAISAFKSSNKIEEFSGNYLDIGTCFFILNEYNKAVEAFRKSNSLIKNVPSYIGIGKSLFQLKDYKGSLENYNKANEIDKGKYWQMAIKFNADDTLKAMGKKVTGNNSPLKRFVLGVSLEKSGRFFRAKEIEKGLLGERIGLKIGDLLLEFDNKSLKGLELNKLINLINNSPANKDANLKIRRDDVELKLILKGSSKSKH